MIMKYMCTGQEELVEAGNKGISIIIAHSREKRKLQSIEKMIKKELTQKFQEVRKYVRFN